MVSDATLAYCSVQLKSKLSNMGKRTIISYDKDQTRAKKDMKASKHF